MGGGENPTPSAKKERGPRRGPISLSSWFLCSDGFAMPAVTRANDPPAGFVCSQPPMTPGRGYPAADPASDPLALPYVVGNSNSHRVVASVPPRGARRLNGCATLHLMGLEIIVSVLGIVIATFVSIWTLRRTNPKRQLRYRVEATPLLAATADGVGRVSVGVDGRPVRNPQIVHLTLWSDGRADIGSASFDGGLPLIFDLGAVIIDRLPDAVPSPIRFEVQEPSRLIVRPTLLPRKFETSARVIVDGTPVVAPNYVLTDVPVVEDRAPQVREAIDTSRQRIRVTPLLVTTGVLALGTISLVFSLIAYAFNKDLSAVAGGISLMVIMLAILVIGIAIFRFLRWVARNVEARSGLRR